MIIPDLVRQKLETLDEEGVKWVEGLDKMIEELEQEWQLQVESHLEGGSEAYVAQAVTRDGTKVILKLAIPPINGNTILANEITALTLADGRGYVRLLRSDLKHRALLLEQLGRPLKELCYSSKEQIEIICTTLKNSWIHVSPGSSLSTGETMAQWFAEFIPEMWAKLNKPCSQRALETALSFAQVRARAFNPETAVLVHGDAHNGNTLQDLSQNSHPQPTFKLIDPDGVVAEPGYDLGVLMREWLEELVAAPVRLGLERCSYLSHLTGANTESIWQWGFLQSMATGLLLLQIGQKQEGSEMLKVAEAWARA